MMKRLCVVHGFDAEAALLRAARATNCRVDHLEPQAEAPLPSRPATGGSTDAGQTTTTQLDLLAEEQLLQDEAGLDGLAEAHVVGDEEVHARQLQRLHAAASSW